MKKRSDWTQRKQKRQQAQLLLLLHAVSVLADPRFAASLSATEDSNRLLDNAAES